MAGGINSDGAPTTFAGTNFGTPTTLILNGGEVKTFKNGISDVFGADIFYRVYKQGDVPGAFTQVSLGFDSDLGGGDQKWATTAAGVDILAAASAGNGTYNLEVFWRAPSSDGDHFDSNGGSNYTATFMVNVLPVELSRFTANTVNLSEVALTWTTSQEINNNYFEVERRTGSNTWETIQRIQGAGNSDYAIDYAFTDKTPEQGLNYYRLKQTDFDGTFDYSTTVKAEITRINISVFPNPSTSLVTVSVPETVEKGTLQIFDASGKIVLNESVSARNEIGVNQLLPGIYFIRISGQRGNVVAEGKFRKL